MTDASQGTVPSGSPLRRAAIFVALVVLAGLFLAPTVGVIFSAFKTTRDISLGELWSIPSRLFLGNFSVVLAKPEIYVYLRNTFIVAVSASFLSITLGSLAGYVFAKLPFFGSELLFLLFVSGLFFPPQIVLIPLFKMFNGMGLIDTLWALIIVHTAMGIPICTLLMRNFLISVPDALRESALVEGVSEWRILLFVVLPISLPALAVLATLQFTWIWNDFLWPLIMVQSDDKRTVMLGLVFLRGQYSVAWGIQGALALLASLPTLLVFLFFQRYFISGMTMGAVKG